jgi:Ca2+/Na+ antiporter
MKNRWFYPFLVVLFGLLTAQAISTAQVYLSNVALYRTLVTVKEAGYLPIPNERTMPHLQQFGPAFFGGLFFTLTVGAGLSLLTLAAAWIWDRIFHRERTVLIPYLVLWLGFLVAVNYRGFCPMVTLCFLSIPLVVFLTTLKTMPPKPKQRIWLNRTVHGLPLLLLAILWSFQMNDDLFLNLRDSLLLSNPLGTKVNDFYYDYTLYPAEVFKTLDQKIIKTSNLQEIHEDSVIRALKKELINRDYVNVGTAGSGDIRITQHGKDLLFENRGRSILQTTQADFLSDPGAVLKEFSERSDRYAFFRQATFLSLLIGFPITLYIFLYTLLRFGLKAFLNSEAVSVTPSILCFLVGAGLLAFYSLGNKAIIETNDLGKALQSKNLNKRIFALKTIERNGLEVSDFGAYSRLLRSPSVLERYCLVKTLGVSRRPETFQDLMAFMDDPQRNVANMAVYALGRRGKKTAVNEILERLKRSEDWYSQWYAYKALRSLGWKQSKSS